MPMIGPACAGSGPSHGGNLTSSSPSEGIRPACHRACQLRKRGRDRGWRPDDVPMRNGTISRVVQGSRAAGLGVPVKLMESAQARWHLSRPSATFLFE
jgi:hypothetical protein